MNKVSCEIIQDLLPLYCDDACSAESRQMVQAHLQSCETCREELRLMGLPIPVPENRHEVEAAHAAARAWKKNKRTAFRMGIILAALLVLLSAVLICGTHYAHSAAGDDTVGLQVLLESYGNMEGIEIDRIVQKGDYVYSNETVPSADCKIPVQPQAARHAEKRHCRDLCQERQRHRKRR